MFDRAWDIIADQEPVEVVLRFAPTVAARVQEARWHPSQQVTVEADGVADVAGDGRRARSRSGSGSCRGATTSRSSRRRRCGTTSRPRSRASRRALRRRRPGLMAAPPVRRGQPDQRPDPRLRRADEAAGRRRVRGRRAAATESAAEEDLLDTPWVQRLRRISQLQSARWVFPTAEHSRFTHGLGVMHEAGLWGRSLYPSLAGELVAARRRRARREGLVVETLRVAGLLHDVGHGPFAHFFDDHVLVALRGAAGPAPARRQAADPRGPLAADHRARAGRR